jgi:predicted dehydrogenase
MSNRNNKVLNVAIIGYGYWGKNLVRNFFKHPNCNIKYVVDTNLEKLNELQLNYNLIATSTDYQIILNDKNIDAIVIATPSSTHFQIGIDSLLAKKHLLIEKPMTISYLQAKELATLAKKQNCIISVDHTFLYTPAVIKMKEIMLSNEIGKINFFDSTRINLGIFQSDVNVLWDLATHDISILNYLLDDKPISVQAIGISHTENKIENIAYLSLRFEDNIIAHFNCSWSSPVKIRMLLIGGDKKMMVFNDLEPSEKLKIYDSRFVVNTEEEKNKILIDYRTGDLFIPKLENTEALENLTKEFLDCIRYNIQPKSNAAFSLEVIRILEAAQISIKNRGKEIFIRDIV